MECAVANLRIALGRAPGAGEIVLQDLRKLLQARRDSRQRSSVSVVAAELLRERCDRLDIEAGLAEIAEQRFGRGQRIQPDRMRDLVRPAGIARQHNGELLVLRRCRRKPMPGAYARDRGSMRSRSGWCARCANCRSGSRSPADLKLTTPASSRPSTSGSTTCMARSAGDRPRSDDAQSSRRAVDSATWNTGQDAVSNGVVPSSPIAENAVALTIAAGGRSAKCALSQSATPGAFNDVTNAP